MGAQVPCGYSASRRSAQRCWSCAMRASGSFHSPTSVVLARAAVPGRRLRIGTRTATAKAARVFMTNPTSAPPETGGARALRQLGLLGELEAAGLGGAAREAGAREGAR